MLMFGRPTASDFRALSLAAGVLMLSACEQMTGNWRTMSDGILSSGNGNSASNNKNVKTSRIGFEQFPDLPVPSGAEININETLVFGSNPWFGQLALKTSSNADVIFDFYRRTLPQHQWQEITSVRAPISILTYVNGDRVLSIAIRDTTLGGAEVTLTVSPREISIPPA